MHYFQGFYFEHFINHKVLLCSWSQVPYWAWRTGITQCIILAVQFSMTACYHMHSIIAHWNLTGQSGVVILLIQPHNYSSDGLPNGFLEASILRHQKKLWLTLDQIGGFLAEYAPYLILRCPFCQTEREYMFNEIRWITDEGVLFLNDASDILASLLDKIEVNLIYVQHMMQS